MRKKANQGKEIAMNVQDISLQTALDLFLLDRKARQLKDCTTSAYFYAVKKFREFVATDDMKEVNFQKLQAYIIFKRNNGITDNTIAGQLGFLRAFFKWCFSEGYLSEFRIPYVKQTQHVKDVYTEDELQILLKKPDIKKCRFWEYETWVLINFYLGTAVRINSAVNVKIQDVDFHSGIIKVMVVKNRKPLTIPLSHTLAIVLKEYLKYRKGNPEDYLFCNSYGEKAETRVAQKQLRDYNLGRGIKKTSAHLFRHTFAKNWILNGGDIFRLQKILGHSSIDIVKMYVSMFANDVAKDFDRFNPLDNICHSGERNRIRMKQF